MNALPTAVHGRFHSNLQPPYAQGTVALLVCDPGYASIDLTESKVIQRNRKLQWDPLSVECLPVDMPTAINGHFDVPDPLRVGSKAELKCDPGFHVFQPIASYLGRGLKWSTPSAICEPVLEDLPEALNGHFESQEPGPYPEGAIVELKCDRGYACKDFSEAYVEGDDRGNLRWIPATVTCVPVLDYLPGAAGGRFVPQANATFPYEAGAVAQLNCLPGHASAVDQSVAEPDASGELKWNPPSATCVPALDHPPPVKNGQYDPPAKRPYTVGTTVEAKCDPGHVLKAGTVGHSTLRSATGYLRWEPATIVCEPALYELPMAVKGHFVADSGAAPPYVEGASAKLKCDVGHKSNIHVTMAVLDANGLLKWSHDSATCTPVTCPAPPFVANGGWEGNDFTFSHTVTLRCDKGHYHPDRNASFYCSSEGNWQIPLPREPVTCRPVLCPEPQWPQFGKVEFTDRDYGAVAKFQCMPGFHMFQGDEERTCQEDGQWSGKPVVCLHTCQVNAAMAKFMKSSSPSAVILDCGNGIEEIVQCDQGAWSKQPPYCQGLANPPQLNPLAGSKEEVYIVPVGPPAKKPKVSYLPAAPPPSPAPSLMPGWIFTLAMILCCFFVIIFICV